MENPFVSKRAEEKDEKKGGGLPGWMQAPARIGGGGAAGSGASATGGAAGVLGKVHAALSSKALLLVSIAGTMLYSGNGVWDMKERGFGVDPTARAPLATGFESRDYDPAQLAGLPGSAGPGSSALDLAARANRGTLGAGAAKPGGEGADGKAAGGEAVEKADAAADAAGATAPGMAMADQMAGFMDGARTQAKLQTGNKFGKLSSGLGGGMQGLSGGAGLAGGIGRGFGQQANPGNIALKQASGLQHGTRGKITRSKTPAGNLAKGTLKGKNAQRLQRMQAAMAPTRAGDAEFGAAEQTRQWETSDTAGGVQGSGASTIGAGVGSGFSPDEGGGGGEPLGNQNYTQPAQSEPPATGGGRNVTPYQQKVDLAKALLMAAAVLNLLAFTLGVIANSTDWLAGAGEAVRTVAQALAGIAAVLGVAVLAIGAMIAAEGQTGQGLIFTLVGGVVGTLSAIAAFGMEPEAAETEQVAEQATEQVTEQVTEQLVSTTGIASSGISGAVAGGGAIQAHNAPEGPKE